uniref:Homeobox domain-containing protein n=1 Tax=Globodera rostochiensis TaxID=31243 RepID=A0A914HG91_GLORO
MLQTTAGPMFYDSYGRVCRPNSPSQRSPSAEHPRSRVPPQLDDVSLFSADQVACICQCLENCADFSGLTFFVERIEKYCGLLANHPARDILHRAKALSLFHCRQFGELYAFIQHSQFVPGDHSLLQRLWNEAHYAEVEHLRGKQLDPVSRYRIRKKNGFPRSIWDGEGTSYCFKKSARQILRETYRRHNMPSQEEKVRLARKTQLSVVQVSNWFKNQRQRARQHRLQQKNDQKIIICSSTESDGTEGEQQNIARRDGGEGRWDDPPAEVPLPGAKMPFLRCTPSSSHFHPSIGHLAVGVVNEAAMKWGRRGRRRNCRRAEEQKGEEEFGGRKEENAAREELKREE